MLSNIRLALAQSYRMFGSSYTTFQSSFSTAASGLDIVHLEGKNKGVVVLGLNRPSVKNAFSRDLALHLRESFEDLMHDPAVRVLIFRSLVPGIFCAGADLKERAKMDPKQVGIFVSMMRGIMRTLYNFPHPTIAAMDGAALGGGLEFALACDLRLSSDDCKMGLVETKLAIIPGAGGTQLLPRLVGPAVAKDLIFTGRIITGQEAKKFGLVNDSVAQNGDGDAAYLVAETLAEQILSQGPVALSAAKQAINHGVEVELGSGLAFEEAMYAKVIPTKDRVEALLAFKEKRKPIFSGH